MLNVDIDVTLASKC